MCGIAGWIDLKKNLKGERQTLELMGQTLRQRGPDDSGVWIDDHAALAHTRLIVIDPAGGSQPMVRRRGEQTAVIVYNGELYNTEELRQELKNRGYHFRSHSDTEVLLTSYLEWGTKCPEKLNGIFAFAVWDPQNRTLFAARDRLGVKPFFFTPIGSSFLFASELKALLAHPQVDPRLDASGLAELFVLGPGHTPGHGLFKDIYELKPGHCLTFNVDGLKIWPYWALESKPHEDDWETTVAKVRHMVIEAVERQLVSDVPICTFLSGGLDSSIITVVAARAMAKKGQTLSTYSVDYRDNDLYFQGNDFQPEADAPFIRQVSEFARTDHHTVVIDTPELIESLQEAVRARDLPGMADIDSSLYLFARGVKRQATVALSGECADEVFGGYPWFRRPEALEARTFPWAITYEVRLPLLSREVKAWIRPEEYLAARYEEALAEVPRLPGEPPRQARLREITYLTLTRWMPTLLDRKDRMTMRCGLEVRVPYCDHLLVEYLWNVPWEMKYYNEREKGLLRHAFSSFLPDEVLWRKKSPYPKTHNPNYLSATGQLLKEVLHDPSSPLIPLVNRDYLLKLTDSQTDLPQPWYGQLMRLPQLFAYLLQMDFWMREYQVRIC